MNSRLPAVLLGALVTATGITAAPNPQWGLALDGNPLGSEKLASATRASGLPAPAFVVFFEQWPERPADRHFPLATLDAIAASGAEPVLTWEPMYYQAKDGAETMIAADAIERGSYDGYIEAFARSVGSWGRPLTIRFAHEMNLSRYHWGGTSAEYGPASPGRYRAMWRHVVQVFRRSGVKNVRWAFCPNCEPVPGAGNPGAAPWNVARAYFPGEDYVDVVGIDGYNWGDTQTPERNGWRSSWRSFNATFAALRQELRGLAPTKPLFVFETACAPSGGDKAAWLAAMAGQARAWQLAGVAWFEVRKEVDWRLATGLEASATAPLRPAFRFAREP